MKNVMIGELLGIKIELHYTFVLLFGFVFFLLLIFDPFHLLNYFVLLGILFTSVLFHELFHSFVALIKGIRVEKISLLPIGGIAYTQKMPEKPIDEFFLALAGPLFNFIIVILVMLVTYLFPGFGMPPTRLLRLEEGFNIALLQYPLFALLWVNFILGIFNLFFPALPLDGGRIARALLATKLGFIKATQIVSNASALLAIFLGIFGLLLGNLLIVIIAVFVFLGAKAEEQTANIKEMLQNVSFRKLIKKGIYLKQNNTLYDAFKIMKKLKKEFAFIRINDSFFYLDLEMLSKIDKNLWKKINVVRIAKRVKPLSSFKNAAYALNQLLEQNILALPVIVNGKLLGIIEEEDLADLYRFKKIEASA